MQFSRKFSFFARKFFGGLMNISISLRTLCFAKTSLKFVKAAFQRYSSHCLQLAADTAVLHLHQPWTVQRWVEHQSLGSGLRITLWEHFSLTASLIYAWVLASDQSSVRSWLVQPIKELSSVAGLCDRRGRALIRQLANWFDLIQWFFCGSCTMYLEKSERRCWWDPGLPRWFGTGSSHSTRPSVWSKRTPSYVSSSSASRQSSLLTIQWYAVSWRR